MIYRSFEEASPFLNKLLELDLACFAESGWDALTWERIFLNQNLNLIILKKKGFLAGFLSFIRIDCQAELLKIAVAPTYRRLGLGRRLMHEMRNQTAKQGVTTIFLEVRHNNRAAIALYLREGFFQQGIRNNYYNNPKADAWLFKRELPKA